MAPRKSASAKQSTFTAPVATEPASTSVRKAWIRKTTSQVVLDQIGRQEKKVADMRADLSHEERELAKLNKAKAVLETD